jgi:asparagine synthetase B (glutamine-hydrolysing)
VPVSSRELTESFFDARWHAETLMFNGHGVAEYLLSRAVRDAGIKVVFTGEGTDEILAVTRRFAGTCWCTTPTSRDRRTAGRAGCNQPGLAGTILSHRGRPPQDWRCLPRDWVGSRRRSRRSTVAATMNSLVTEAYLRADPYRKLLDSLMCLAGS